MPDNDHDDDDQPSIDELEEVNMENLKRAITPPVSTWTGVLGFIAGTILSIWLIDNISEWIVGTPGENAKGILFFLMIASMGLVTVALSAASGSILGLTVFTGERRVPRTFRIAMGIVQACMLAGCIGLVVVLIR